MPYSMDQLGGGLTRRRIAQWLAAGVAGATVSPTTASAAATDECDAPLVLAQSGPRERVLQRMTVGKGRFSDDGRFILLEAKMFDCDGRRDGFHQGVFESIVPPDNLFQWTPDPPGPFDDPHPVAHAEIRAHTEAIWVFGDGSSITAVGPAVVHIGLFSDNSLNFFVTVAGSITSGTGRFKGARGVKSALGSTYLPPGSAFGPGSEFPGKTVETFRIVRASQLQNP